VDQGSGNGERRDSEHGVTQGIIGYECSQGDESDGKHLGSNLIHGGEIVEQGESGAL
jgi:hypothetical protein